MLFFQAIVKVLIRFSIFNARRSSDPNRIAAAPTANDSMMRIAACPVMSSKKIIAM